MKIRTKLIISFCIVLFVPILLTYVFLEGYTMMAERSEQRDSYIIESTEAPSDTSDGSSSFYITTPTQGQYFQVRILLWQLSLALLAILFITAAMIVIWFHSSVLIPVQHLKEAADKISEGNLDFKLNISGDDELGELARSFEAMRKRLKDNAEEKLKDEKENRALISNIAHDLKTPITAVKGYSEGILDGVANTPEKVEKYVRTIYAKAGEMDTLINELTLYSKIDTNRIPYNFVKLNVKEYFSDCLEEIGMDLEARNITLTYDNRVDADTLVIADPEQLRRVIGNIVGNACKYMDKPRGTIDLQVTDVGDFIQVSFADNGKGIAQKDIPYIFDRFYRTDSSRNSSTGGSGIGLSIVKKIIEDHGGKIWATSREGEGTTMYFVLRKFLEIPQPGVKGKT